MKNIMVSIGMIVKNEEQYMKACLDSLKPLMDCVSSELVIVDTGSTDRTVEIAREYTDKIYHFDWINDFAAARNFGLEKCTGDWFMYTDADTIFDTNPENMQPLIDFFKDKKINEKYRSATYITRNYSNLSHTDYSEHIEFRITRRTTALRFVGAIHEVFNCTTDRICMLNTYAHHYGYCYANLAEASAKSKRNSDLLKIDIEKEPKNLRLINMLFDSTVIHEEKVEIIEKAVLIARESKKNPYAAPTFVRAVNFYAGFDYVKAEEYIKTCIGFISENDATLIDVYFAYGQIKEQLHDYESALEPFLKCYDLQKRYKADELHLGTLALVTLQHIGRDAAADTLRHALFCMANLGKVAEAAEYLDNEYDNLSYIQFILILDNYILIGRDYSILRRLYKRFLDGGDKEKITSFEIFLEKQYCKATKRSSFIDEMADAGGDFGELMRLVKMSESENLRDKISDFAEKLTWRAGFSELIYLALKYDCDIKKVIEKCDFERMSLDIEIINANHSDFAEIIMNKCKISDFSGSITEVFWLMSAFEAIVFTKKIKPNEKDSQTRLDAYNSYIELLSLYVLNVYNPNLLNDTDVNILPELHRFGYRMAVAKSKLSEGDKAGYIRELKNALVSCERAKDIIVAVMDDFLKNIN